MLRERVITAELPPWRESGRDCERNFPVCATGGSNVREIESCQDKTSKEEGVT